MPYVFPILRRQTCNRDQCELRVPFSPSKAKLIVYAAVARIAFLMVCAAVVGGSLSGLYVFAQPQPQYRFPDPATGVLLLQQRIENNEAEMKKMQEHIVLQDSVIASQANAISEMHGIGLAVGGILTCLTLIQMVLGNKLKKQLNE